MLFETFADLMTQERATRANIIGPHYEEASLHVHYRDDNTALLTLIEQGKSPRLFTSLLELTSYWTSKFGLRPIITDAELSK